MEGDYAMDATVIGGYATAAGVIISVFTLASSVFTLAYQSRKARFNTSVQLVLELEKRFNNPSFEAKRQQAATAILAKPTDVSGAEPIFDLFEMIGYLVKKGAIADELALIIFYYWVHGYWTIGKMHIRQRRSYEKDVDVWSYFEYLHNRCPAYAFELALRYLADSCLVLVDRQLQLVHEFAQS
jgi:hypothetical protein